MVRRALGALLEVVGGGPAAVKDAFLGVLMVALAFELGAEIAPMNVALVAAMFGAGGDAGVLLQAGGGLETLALRALTSQESGRQDRPGAGQAGKDVPIRVVGEGLSNLLVVALDGLDHQIQLSADQLHA